KRRQQHQRELQRYRSRRPMVNSIDYLEIIKVNKGLLTFFRTAQELGLLKNIRDVNMNTNIFLTTGLITVNSLYCLFRIYTYNTGIGPDRLKDDYLWIRTTGVDYINTVRDLIHYISDTSTRWFDIPKS